LRINLTAGNVNDIVPACDLIEDLLADKLLADRAYDANKLLALAERQSHAVVIPLTPRRLGQREYDAHACKERHLAECFFINIKSFRMVITRYDKLAVTFKASGMLAACLVWRNELFRKQPLMSGFVTQRAPELGRTDTEFGLNVTYLFNMRWEEQISPSKVSELRTVSGAKHEFVGRENRIILEYQAEDGAYCITLLRYNRETGEFVLRLQDGFGRYPSGVRMDFSVNDGATVAPVSDLTGPDGTVTGTIFKPGGGMVDLTARAPFRWQYRTLRKSLAAD
jgi:transposase